MFTLWDPFTYFFLAVVIFLFVMYCALTTLKCLEENRDTEKMYSITHYDVNSEPPPYDYI